jgi:hypothetical protein
MACKPVASANWSMEMTVAENQAFLRRIRFCAALSFVRHFRTHAGELFQQVQAALCPSHAA